MYKFCKTFKLEDDRYIKLINMTREDPDRAIDRLTDIHSRFYNLIGTKKPPIQHSKKVTITIRKHIGFHVWHC